MSGIGDLKGSEKSVAPRSQKTYARTVLERFGMDTNGSVPTPMVEAQDHSKRLESDGNNYCDKSIPYREAIGSLMYLMIGTRPDLAYAVGKLAQFSERREEKHWTAVKRVLRYVTGSRDFEIKFDGKKEIVPIGFSDSDWAGDVKDRKSTGGYVFQMCGGAVTWSSRKQTVVATSSCEGEYIALCAACKEASWLIRIVGSLLSSIGEVKSVKIFSDSQSAMKLSENNGINRRNKYIDITYHYVRDVVSKGIVNLEYVPTTEMTADMLTKPIARVKLEKLRGLCGLTNGKCDERGGA